MSMRFKRRRQLGFLKSLQLEILGYRLVLSLMFNIREKAKFTYARNFRHHAKIHFTDNSRGILQVKILQVKNSAQKPIRTYESR